MVDMILCYRHSITIVAVAVMLAAIIFHITSFESFGHELNDSPSPIHCRVNTQPNILVLGKINTYEYLNFKFYMLG